MWTEKLLAHACLTGRGKSKKLYFRPRQRVCIPSDIGWAYVNNQIVILCVVRSGIKDEKSNGRLFVNVGWIDGDNPVGIISSEGGAISYPPQSCGNKQFIPRMEVEVINLSTILLDK